MSMKTKYCIVFDFDGTLANTQSEYIKAYNQVAKEFELKEIDEETKDLIRSMHLKDIFKTLNIPKAKLTEIYDKVIEKVFQNGGVKLYQGVKAALMRLKNVPDVQLGIISSTPHEYIKKFVQEHKINFFSFIIGGVPFFEKEQVFDQILKEVKVSPSHIIYLTDEVRDIEAAKASGIKCIAVTWGVNLESVLKKYKPDKLIRHPDEIIPENLLEVIQL